MQDLEAAHAREADLEQRLHKAQSGLSEIEGTTHEAAALQQQVAALDAKLEVRPLLNWNRLCIRVDAKLANFRD